MNSNLFFHPGFLLSVKICPSSGKWFFTLSRCSWLSQRKGSPGGNNFWLDWQQRGSLNWTKSQKHLTKLCHVGVQFSSRDTLAQFSELQCVSSRRETAPVSTAFVNPAFGMLALISRAARLLRLERFGGWVTGAVRGLIRGDYEY